MLNTFVIRMSGILQLKNNQVRLSFSFRYVLPVLTSRTYYVEVDFPAQPLPQYHGCNKGSTAMRAPRVPGCCNRL